jgi:hypothetical protein
MNIEPMTPSMTRYGTYTTGPLPHRQPCSNYSTTFIPTTYSKQPT